MATKEAVLKKDPLQEALEMINKQQGAGSVYTIGDFKPVPVERLRPGSIGLYDLSGGGYPEGRIIELDGWESSGKTTISLLAVAAAQKKYPEKRALYIDGEHALDLKYARTLGVDTDLMILSQPDCMEEGYRTIEALVKSGQISVVVFDSVAGTITEKELEGELGETSALGVKAKLMSQAMPKFSALLNNTKTTGFWINQFREKIGVMFGCFPYHTEVKMADGSTERIGKLVNNKDSREVLTYNIDKKIFENKPIINWFNNGKYSKLVRVKTLSPHGRGNTTITVADDHTFITKNGEEKLSELVVGDLLLTKSKKFLNKEQQSLILGGYLGDGSIRTNNNITYKYRETHAIKQNKYCEFKANVLSNFVSSKGYDKNGKFWFECHTTSELSGLKNFKSKGLLKLDDKLINQIDLLSLAIWYLDDGTFSGSYKKWGNGKCVIYCTNLDIDSKNLVALHLKNKLNLDVSVIKAGFSFSGENSKKFQIAISKYVPKCMSYKINPKFHDLVGIHNYDAINDIREVLIDVPILSIDIIKNNNKNPFKYDLQIEGNNNYMVSDILVHNSPITTPGGNALKFTASIRLELRQSEKQKNTDGDINGIKIKVKCIKNKTAAPFKECEYNIIFGEGIDKHQEIIDYGVALGIINKAGSWFSYGDTKLGQGSNGVKSTFADNPDLADELEDLIYKGLDAQ